MTEISTGPLARMARLLRVFFLTGKERAYLKAIEQSGMFDPVYYRGAYPGLNPIYQRHPARHFILFGENSGYRPNPDFVPHEYLRFNPDIKDLKEPAFWHYIRIGHTEERVTKYIPPKNEALTVDMPVLRFDPARDCAPFAVVAHVYYPDLWPEFADQIRALDIDYDLYVTLTYRGDESDELADQIRQDFPGATVVCVPNRGRDILPFLALVNAGALDSYQAVCKIHTKKSPHRQDGEEWRRHLIGGILPDQGLTQLLSQFLNDETAAFWVADGQHYTGEKWWGTNFGVTQFIMQRLEVEISRETLSFPAGSIYWMKPLMVGLLKALNLDEYNFEPEEAQVDGTLAHGLERAMGYLAMTADQEVVQTAQLRQGRGTAPAPERMRPQFTSAFYLPQFHPIPENDAWWGPGFTEWRGTAAARPSFAGHTQPLLPSDLGFYDLRVTDVMGQQAALARQAGIDAFCVYHYWFDGRRVLEQPLDGLLARPDVDFPFYLCWANESWRRNWDGLSGEVLLDQTYAPGFEDKLVADSLPYMRDERYARPDGTRPRFVIYRPEDMPDPTASVARMRAAWAKAGFDVELGAVCFHVGGEAPVADDLFDFWIEMPPHGMVTLDDYLYGGPDGNLLGRDVRPGFAGLIYDYTRVIANSMDAEYVSNLPQNTICGAMPSWDNTARRGMKAHMAYGANPARFGLWLRQLADTRLAGSYRQELFLNAWNEWAEKAVLEPNTTHGDLYLTVLRQHIGPQN